MEELRRNEPSKLVFGLDIGTRSIVGTVGYKSGGQFHVVAQRIREHETRAMLDGQIHDIDIYGSDTQGGAGDSAVKSYRFRHGNMAGLADRLDYSNSHVTVILCEWH